MAPVPAAGARRRVSLPTDSTHASDEPPILSEEHRAATPRPELHSHVCAQQFERTLHSHVEQESFFHRSPSVRSRPSRSVQSVLLRRASSLLIWKHTRTSALNTSAQRPKLLRKRFLQSSDCNVVHCLTCVGVNCVSAPPSVTASVVQFDSTVGYLASQPPSASFRTDLTHVFKTLPDAKKRCRQCVWKQTCFLKLVMVFCMSVTKSWKSPTEGSVLFLEVTVTFERLLSTSFTEL